jgi:hypothetical protein
MPVELGVGAGGALLVLEADPARRCHDPESTPPACTSGTRLAPKLIFLKIPIPSDLVGGAMGIRTPDLLHAIETEPSWHVLACTAEYGPELGKLRCVTWSTV